MIRTFFKLFPQVFYETPGAGGSGGGAGAGSGAGTGQSSGAGGSQGLGSGAGASGGAGGGGGSQAVPWSDDGRFQTSDGRTVTGAELRSEMQREWEQTHGQRYTRGYNLLMEEAKRLDQQRQRGQQQQRQQPQQQADPYAEIEGMQYVDGRTVATLARQLQAQGLAPIAQALMQQQQTIAQLSQRVQGFSGHVGTQNEERAANDFEGNLDRILPTVQIKGYEGKIDPKSEGFRQIARNLYLSYEPDSWRPGEFQKMLGDTLTQMYVDFKKLQTGAVEEGRRKMREHFNPNRGGATPQGQPRYQFQRGRDIAKMAREAGIWSGAATT